MTDGRRRKAALAEVPVETIDVERLQARQPDLAEHRDDLPVDVLPVVVQRRVGPAQARDVFHPSIEQRRQRRVIERHVAGHHRGLERGQGRLRLALRCGRNGALQLTYRYSV